MVKLPCLVSPERDDLVDTDDCTETTEDVSGMVLSVIKPPPSPSVWTVIVDWQKEAKGGEKEKRKKITCTSLQYM